MFGEKQIVGQTIIRVKKDRIILPGFTHVEVGDKVSATIDAHQKKIILLQERELIERLEILHKKLQLAYGEKRLSYKEYRNLERHFFAILPLHERTINKQLEYQLYNRSKVDSFELRQLQRLNLKDEIFAVGVGTTLELYPDEEAYHEYQSMEEKRKLKIQPK